MVKARLEHWLLDIHLIFGWILVYSFTWCIFYSGPICRRWCTAEITLILFQADYVPAIIWYCLVNCRSPVSSVEFMQSSKIVYQAVVHCTEPENDGGTIGHGGRPLQLGCTEEVICTLARMIKFSITFVWHLPPVLMEMIRRLNEIDIY